ncbi:hypothetical protein BG006_010787 [Podila minutissima]|uniref:F-box domain-containing protein n=1 Tax=Podila minutissima TaxID=64525 RepID=A0A9P5VQ00_9FUNG|nr:hypothetical protein BG006_010787 [Podila minutissima]
MLQAATTEHSSLSHESHMEDSDSASGVFPFELLPIEIQLQVVRAIASEKDLLQFRRVSSMANALVLEPVFWQTLQFSKQRYFKTGSSASSSFSSTATLKSDPRRTSVHHQPSLFHSALEGYPQMHQHQHQYHHHPQISHLQPAFVHSSDANLIVHRQSFAASLLGGGGSHHQNVFSSGLGGTSSEEDAMIPTTTTTSSSSSPSSSSHSSDQLLSKSLPTGVSIMSTSGKICAWAKKEISFLAFLTRLTNTTRITVQGVRRATIDDWEGETTVGDLWDGLLKMEQLQELSIRHSVLKQLQPSPGLTLVAASHGQYYSTASPSWQHLTLLDLRDCLQLMDLSGINRLMPNLLEVNLEGCLGLNDFGPLSKVGGGGVVLTSTKETIGIQELKFRKINLSRTKVHDQDLVRILQRSPHLQELRLDQCYDLTVASLVVIGQGHEHGPAGHVLSTATPTPTTTSSSSTSSVPGLRVLSVKNCCDLTDEGIRALVGCRQLELLIIRGLRRVDDDTIEWLHSQGVPLRRVLNPLGKWRYWHV